MSAEFWDAVRRVARVLAAVEAGDRDPAALVAPLTAVADWCNARDGWAPGGRAWRDWCDPLYGLRDEFAGHARAGKFVTGRSPRAVYALARRVLRPLLAELAQLEAAEREGCLC